jgi:D-amino peptidase
MKFLISCDMEGISGIVDWEQVTPGKDEWKRGRKLMAGDVNAAINGAFEAGAEAVTVSDAHWHARTLELEELDPRAHLNSGSPSPFSMMQGIDDEPRFDGVAFVGCHAMAGAKKGVLCHTWSDNVAGVWLNDVAVGEIGLNAAVAGHYGTPVVAVSGDNIACLEAQNLLGADLDVAVVKLGTGRYAAECLPLAESREKICEAVARGVGTLRVKSGAGGKLYKIETPARLAAEFKFPHQTDRAFLVPGTRRLSGTRIEFTGEDMVVAIRAFRAMVALAGPNE